MQKPEEDNALRRIRSFVRREGRMTPGQKRALETYWPSFGVDIGQGVLDLANLFVNPAPIYIDIGFGRGESLIGIAKDNPDNNYLGIEVHRPGVGSCLLGLAEAKLTNAKILCADASEIFAHYLPEESIDGVMIFFPDPWHKKKHHKRRLIQIPFIQRICQALKPGGKLHIATDWQPYAEHCLEVLAEISVLENQAGVGLASPRPDYRPKTKYEKRGERLGHDVWDLIFIKKYK